MSTELPPITDDDRQFLHYNPNTADVVSWIQAYALAAVEMDRARRLEGEQFVLDGTPDIQMIQNVADPEGAIQAHWPDEYLAWYKPEEWMGPHRAVCVFIGNKIRAALSRSS